MKIRLRELRTARGWTQDVMADRLGVTKSHISEMESGKKNASAPVLERMAAIFSVKVSDLIGNQVGDDPGGLSDLMKAYEALEDEDRAAVLQMAQRLASRAS